jgi:hypothetical protein
MLCMAMPHSSVNLIVKYTSLCTWPNLHCDCCNFAYCDAEVAYDDAYIATDCDAQCAVQYDAHCATKYNAHLAAYCVRTVPRIMALRISCRVL